MVVKEPGVTLAFGVSDADIDLATVRNATRSRRTPD